jgi:hypothetical protein
MPRVRPHQSASLQRQTARTVEAVVLRTDDAAGFDDALRQIGLLSALHARNGAGTSVAIATDGMIPSMLFSYLMKQGISRIVSVPFTVQRILPENSKSTLADPTDRITIAHDLALCRPWVESDIRIVVSRVKTDDRGAYSLCCAVLAACVSPENFEALLERFPPHCAIAADFANDTPAVAANHPLLADWIGATLMGRNPFSALANAERFRRGLLPRTYRIHGDTTPIASWRTPPSLKRYIPSSSCCDSIIRYCEKDTADTLTAGVTTIRSFMKSFRSSLESAVLGESSHNEPKENFSTRESVINRLASALSPESMGEILETALKGIGLLCIFHSGLKEEVQTLRAVYLFATTDRRMTVTAEFSNGLLKVGRGAAGPINVALIFHDIPAMMRLFATPQPNLLHAILSQQISFEGNLNYLLKLAYLLRRISLIAKGELKKAV